MSARRGRPRSFDEDAALDGAMALFWRRGFSATSLDELAAAMNMNRPSIYNAFGNKQAIYRRTLDRFAGRLDLALDGALEANDLRAGLRTFFRQALEVYCGEPQALGCLVMCTAPAEARIQAEVGEVLADLVARVDRRLAEAIRGAVARAELPADTDALLTAKLLQGTLHTLALRARAGESKAGLHRLATEAVRVLLPEARKL